MYRPCIFVQKTPLFCMTDIRFVCDKANFQSGDEEEVQSRDEVEAEAAAKVGSGISIRNKARKNENKQTNPRLFDARVSIRGGSTRWAE